MHVQYGCKGSGWIHNGQRLNGVKTESDDHTAAWVVRFPSLCGKASAHAKHGKARQKARQLCPQKCNMCDISASAAQHARHLCPESATCDASLCPEVQRQHVRHFCPKSATRKTPIGFSAQWLHHVRGASDSWVGSLGSRCLPTKASADSGFCIQSAAKLDTRRKMLAPEVPHTRHRLVSVFGDCIM